MPDVEMQQSQRSKPALFKRAPWELAELHLTLAILASISKVLSLTVMSRDRVYAEIQWRVALR